MLKKINKYLFGNLISIPLYASRTSEGGKKLREIFSYLPITDIAVDVENAVYNPTSKNIAAAGITGAMNFLGAKYLKYLTKGSKEVKQLAKLAKDKYNELLKLYKENLKSLVRSRSTREEALRLRQQASDAFSDYNTYNKIGSTILAPEYFLYSIWPALDAGINTVLNQKQGGMLELLKKGSGIHIKKENKGKFTDYCGGKVTSTCIAKGKNSSNPAVRKRATFAANARKWKHKSGGVVKALMGWLANLSYKLGLGSKGDWRRMKSDLVNLGILLDNSENPNQQIGAPNILPGTVNMDLYKNAKTVLKGVQNNERFVNFVDRLVRGKINPKNIGVKNKHFTDPSTYVDLRSETVPKGFIKGNEITPDMRYPITEEGLSTRIVKSLNLENPITNEAEALAARDYLKILKEKGQVKFKKGGKAFVEGVNVLDSNPKAYKYVKKKYKMAQLGTKLQKIGSGIGKALNSDLGKALINGIPSLISSNNAINGYGDTVKALIDRDMADKRLEARQNSIQLADLIINNSFDPENPNNMGGDIVKGFITNNILNSNMAGLELEAKNQKAQIDIENQQLKNQATSLFLGNIGNLATDYIASKALSKNGAPSDKMKQAYFNVKKFGIV